MTVLDSEDVRVLGPAFPPQISAPRAPPSPRLFTLRLGRSSTSTLTVAYSLSGTLNIAVLLIGKISALTMNVSGVIKDWLLIGLPVVLFASPVSGLQFFGYLIAFVAVYYKVPL